MVLRTSAMINPDHLASYVTERLVDTNRFMAAGVLYNDPMLNTYIRDGGTTGRMPFYQQLTGASEVLGDNPLTDALTIGNTTIAAERYQVCARGRAFGASDLAKAFSGDDPMKALGDMIAGYWNTRVNLQLIATLTGTFAAANMTTNVHDVSATIGDGGVISADTLVDAKQLLGDRSDELSVIVMHSAMLASLRKQQLVDELRDVDFSGSIPFFMGLQVVTDDACAYDTGTNIGSTYIMGRNSVAYAGNAAPVPIEFDRDKLTGIDVVISRLHNVIHPRGISMIDVTGIAGETPDDAELADGTVVMTRVFDPKNMPMIHFRARSQ